MTAVIQLSYIHRGLLRAAKPTYKKGHSLNIWIPLFCLESSAEARHLFAEVFCWYMTDIYWNLLLVYGC
jgi:hypothetical protein